MKVVLDTNVLLVSVSRNSPLHWIWQSMLDKKYTLCVTTDILLEYEEILERHMGTQVSKNVMESLDNMKNVERVTRWFQFNLIPKDSDDNKFVDCAVACNASFIVSHDKDFNVLKKIPFPKVEVISTTVFWERLEQRIQKPYL